MGEVASAARRRGLSLKLLRPFPANIRSCSKTYQVVTPSQAFTRKISRLFVAVAIFKGRATATLTTQGEACHCAKWRWTYGFTGIKMDFLRGIKRRRFLICAPPPSPRAQCYSVKRFTQAYVITTCAFFVSKKSLGLQKNIKTSKKGLTNPQKFEAPPVSKGTTQLLTRRICYDQFWKASQKNF